MPYGSFNIRLRKKTSVSQSLCEHEIHRLCVYIVKFGCVYIIKTYAAGAEVNAKHANYYMPAQHEDEAPPSKKMCKSVPRPTAMHILGRRYALTATAYKYLNIGISVGAEPVIDIVIDDNRGKQLLLPILECANGATC
ncbi:uncharacterized protein LOC112589741 [Harpegnathos saltator]|uniref:uncharacterized protein LOC112589741 n=1 Tax=Harpegnathos saltator TaxID=610380 RepID=UPI000DBEE12F|nr:uncharacterized protein LOC112589741 [Harpegnathos saltator]